MSKEFDEHLVRFRNLPLPVRVVYGRPRTFIALAIGVIAFLLLPGTLRLPTGLVATAPRLASSAFGEGAISIV